MTVIWVLLPLAVILGAAFVGMFVWATRDGQFDDTQTPQIRMLFDEEPAKVRARTDACGSKKERS